MGQGDCLWLASGQTDFLPHSLPSGKKREFRFHPIKETVVEEPVDITPYLDQLDESLRDKVLQLQKGRWVQAPWQPRSPARLHERGRTVQFVLGNMGCEWAGLMS